MLPARGRVAGAVGRPPRAAGGRRAIARDRDAPRAAAGRGRGGRSVGRSPGLPGPQAFIEARPGAAAGRRPPGTPRAPATLTWINGAGEAGLPHVPPPAGVVVWFQGRDSYARDELALSWDVFPTPHRFFPSPLRGVLGGGPVQRFVRLQTDGVGAGFTHLPPTLLPFGDGKGRVRRVRDPVL
jgi:hypothetical protein